MSCLEVVGGVGRTLLRVSICVKQIVTRLPGPVVQKAINRLSRVKEV